MCGRLVFDPLMIEPLCLIKIEFCTTLVNFFYSKLLGQLVEREQFLIGAIIPPQQGQHVYKSLGQKATLTKAFRQFAAFGIFPVHSKYREAILGAIAFTEFTGWSQ